MEQSNNTRHEHDFFQTVLIIVRKYLLLILAVVLASLAIGVLVAQTSKPYYVASEPVVYNVYAENNGSSSNSSSEEKYAFSVRRLLLNTIVDFCRQGIVLDRAEYYYDEYLKLGDQTSEGLQSFIDDVTSKTKYVYNVETHLKEKRVHFGEDTTVGSKAVEESEESQNLTFTISVKDQNANSAKDKLRIFALAVDMELSTNNEMFPNMKNSIKELGAGEEEGRSGISAYCTLSKSKIIVTASFIGIISSLILATILFYTDNTVKERYEIEALTGTALLANIEMINEGE